MLTRNLSKTVNIASSSRQVFSMNRLTLLSRYSNCSQADANSDVKFSITGKDGKRLTGEQYWETVKETLSKTEELVDVPKPAFDVLLSEYDATLKDSKDIMDKYTRSLAETENVRRRGLKQTEDAKQFAIQGFCKDLLEVADILDLAVGSIKKEELESADKSLKDLYDGIVMTKSVMLKTFAKHGLVAVDPMGAKFDPNLHEAVFQIPAAQSDKEPGTVAHVAKIGYSLKERPIRAAQVGVVSE